ncbi:hypothetical protein ACFWHT_06500 [Microbacterium sp. NPDC058342]|uniref:hypothetical protein n=1 Tax=Microbacterium sp. NPDC058342 TaxID=3346454 RepID=UPI00365FB284
MSESVTAADERPKASSPFSRALRGLLTGVAGLAHAFVIWTAVFYAIQLAVGGMSAYGWVVLLLPAVVTAIVFSVVLVLTRRRSPGTLALGMAAGLGLSAVFLLDTFSYAIRNLAALTGG